jgi:hypothetical protein
MRRPDTDQRNSDRKGGGAPRSQLLLASDPVGELPPKEAEMLRVELTKLGDAREPQIAGIVEVRWAQLTGCVAYLTRH